MVGGVEFLLEEPSEEPPDLVSSEVQRPAFATHRGRWRVLGAATLAVVAGLWTATRPSDRGGADRRADRQVSPSYHHSAPPAPGSDGPPRPCQGSPFCAVSAVVPGALRQALREDLPMATSSVQVRTYVGESLISRGAYLAERAIDVVGGSVEVLIAVHRIAGPVPGPTVLRVAPLGTGSMIIHRRTDAFVIDVQYLAPETVPPSVARLRVLAVDPRLESL